MKVPLALEGLTAEEIEIVCEVFRSGNLTMGERVKNFELEFANKFGSKFAVMVNSGSSANLLALEVMRNNNRFADRANQYIAVPAVLWPTSLWPIIQLGYKALIIDTTPGTLDIDLDQLQLAREKYGSRLVGAVVIHPLGNSLDLQAIKKLKAGSDFFILEDNAESLGSGNGNEFAGTVGDFGSYSFYYSHHMTTVEGGMVTTNCEEFANDLLSMRAHGWTRNRGDKLKTEQLYPNLPNEFLFVTPGFNFRPMEFQGALGSSQLKRLDLFISKRIQNAKLINQALSHSRFRLIGSESFGQEFEQNVNYGPVKHSWMALPISCGVNSVEKNEICKKLEGVGIATRPLLAGDFSSQPAGNYPGIEIYGQLDNSKEIYATSFMIGNHHNYSDSQMDYLASKLVEISAQYE